MKKILSRGLSLVIAVSLAAVGTGAKNVFDMERYVEKQRTVVKPTDCFEVYKFDVNKKIKHNLSR